MDSKILTRHSGPWLHSAIGAANELVDSLRTLDAEGKLFARVVRGNKAETTAQFFDEIAAAMQFVPEFGENWDALLDCLSDTHGSTSKAIVICILEGARFLKMATPDQRQDCLKILEEAARRLNAAGRSLHVIWHSTARHAADLHALWPDLSPWH
jgi:RNAse (barnase) inhibitor barstar